MFSENSRIKTRVFGILKGIYLKRETKVSYKALASSCLMAVLGRMTSPKSGQIDGSFITSVHT